MPSGYVVFDEPRSGAENMAIDQALLEFAGREHCVILRLYSWSRPTLSLGYFQKYDARLTHQPSRDLDIVRRSTGGGAIVHDHDWTYSVCVPDDRLRSKLGAVPELYETIHESVISWLAGYGIRASRFREDGSCPTEGCSFLCFERRSAGDVVAHDTKLLGSAQRRKHHALLQHGSLLLERSTYAPSLDGTKELLALERGNKTEGGPTELFDKLSASQLDFGKALVDSVQQYCEISLQESKRIDDFVEFPVNPGIFSQDSWLRRR